MLIFCHFCNSGYFRNHRSRLRLPHGHSFMKPSDVWWKTKTTHVNEKILDWVTAKLATAGSQSNFAHLLAWTAVHFLRATTRAGVLTGHPLSLLVKGKPLRLFPVLPAVASLELNLQHVVFQPILLQLCKIMQWTDFLIMIWSVFQICPTHPPVFL